jgi:hypothetical protein
LKARRLAPPCRCSRRRRRAAAACGHCRCGPAAAAQCSHSGHWKLKLVSELESGACPGCRAWQAGPLRRSSGLRLSRRQQSRSLGPWLGQPPSRTQARKSDSDDPSHCGRPPLQGRGPGMMWLTVSGSVTVTVTPEAPVRVACVAALERTVTSCSDSHSGSFTGSESSP